MTTMPMSTKKRSTAPWATAKGGSLWVGASTRSRPTFWKACTTATKTLR